MLEAKEDSLVVGVRPLTNDKDLAALHSSSCLIMIAAEEEIIYEMEEVITEVEDLPIIAINAINWAIDHSSVQITKKLKTEENI